LVREKRVRKAKKRAEAFRNTAQLNNIKMNDIEKKSTQSKLSAVIITKNEARHIEACINSVGFADEVLIVDSGSTDETAVLASRLGARVIHQDWLGFGAQKRFAVQAAQNDWVLCLDADERVDDDLAAQIRRAVSQASAFAYELAMQQKFMGRMLNHGDGYPLWKLRLFHRGHAQWSDDAIHESVKTNTPIQRLEGRLLHVPEISLDEWIAKQNRYTQLQAEALHRQGKRVGARNIVLNPIWRFVKYYVLQRGFLDGVPGFVHAFLSAAFVAAKYAKAWMLGLQKPNQ
jgi:glycosyltransferase involved in cell wall biosynthesis